MTLDGLQSVEQQIGQLDQEMASLLRQHQDAVERLAGVPGLGVDSAQQIIAKVGAKAATFPSAEKLSSWVGACPGEEVRGREPQPTLAEGQPPDAPRSQSSGECRCQTQGEHLRDRVPSSSAAPRTQQNHRRDCPSPLSPDLDNFA
jgi:hypothetical protein